MGDWVTRVGISVPANGNASEMMSKIECVACGKMLKNPTSGGFGYELVGEGYRRGSWSCC